MGKKEDVDKAIIVAHYFMSKSKADQRKDFTNKKLQKLLYYAQAWSLAIHNKRLFDNKFEAWIHGAALPAVYHRYKEFGFEQISEEYDESEFNQLTDQQKELLDEVWEVYGKYDPDYLEAINHAEKPWQLARQDLAMGDRSNAEISEDVMREYYAKRIKEAKEAKTQT